MSYGQHYQEFVPAPPAGDRQVPSHWKLRLLRIVPLARPPPLRQRKRWGEREREKGGAAVDKKEEEETERRGGFRGREVDGGRRKARQGRDGQTPSGPSARKEVTVSGRCIMHGACYICPYYGWLDGVSIHTHTDTSQHAWTAYKSTHAHK